MRKKYKVKLTLNQRKQLLEIVHNGTQQAKTITYAIGDFEGRGTS